jgi:hypothetical protein
VQQAAAALDVHEEECNQHCFADRDSKGDDGIKRPRLNIGNRLQLKTPAGDTPPATINTA